VGLVALAALNVRANDESFRPIVEAEMPAGFPEVTPVGKVQIKEYPAYRKAEADTSAGSAFWTLFSHIKENEIAMIAPVEMRYADGGRPSENRMAFLYGRTDMGKAGRQERVEVSDVPAMTVISTGVRGPRTAAAVAEARERLTGWLDANQAEYTSAGPLRVMAYNSPFVPRNRNFFEVEIPIRATDASESTDTQ